MHKLLIKTHNKTGLKYLCYTQKTNHDKYKGSGTRWKHHLKLHGYDVTTILLFESELYDEFVAEARLRSKEYDVVNDSNWANLRIEEGDGGDTVSNKRWITNGVEDRYHLRNEEVPFGWKCGRSNCVFNNSNNQKQFNKKANRNSAKQIAATTLMGSKNTKSLVLFGVQYASRKEAMEKLNVTKCKLYMMINDDNNRKNQ
jgi:hypothetical protein